MGLILLLPPSLGRLKATARAQLLADTLSRWFKDVVAVEVAPTYGEIQDRVLRAEVDMAWAPPSVCAAAESNAAAIFKSVRMGRSEYCSALIGRAKRPPSFDTLQGLRAAWVDPLSTGGHLLPVSLLKKHGLDPAKLFADQRFHGSYQGALLAVLGGEADVSAVYSSTASERAARETLVAHVGASETDLAPFAFTDASPNDGLIVTRRKGDVTAMVDDIAHVIDGARGPTLLLEIFEADTLIRARPGDYSAVGRALS